MDNLFYDCAEKAIDAAILRSGKSYEEIASALWPHLKSRSAYARLKASLNEDKSEKLDLSEIILICKICNEFDPIYFACDELSLYRPEVKAPHDEQAELGRQLDLTVERGEYLLDRIKKIRMEIRSLRAVPAAAHKRGKGGANG